MSIENILILAAKNRYRFSSPKGDLSFEDLFSLHLQSDTGKANLNDIAIALHNETQAASTAISFVTPVSTKRNDEAANKLELVKLVIGIKIAERDAALEAKTKAEARQKIMALMATKKDEALGQLSIEELQKLLDAA
jgi:hypothetical protein